MGGLADQMLDGDPAQRAVAQAVLVRAIEIRDELDADRLRALFGG